MEQKVNSWLVHGGVERSIWCEVHNTPHCFRYTLYTFSEPAAGHLLVQRVKEVMQCDLR